MQLESYVKIIELVIGLAVIMFFGVLASMYWALALKERKERLQVKEDEITKKVNSMPIDDVVKLNNESGPDDK